MTFTFIKQGCRITIENAKSLEQAKQLAGVNNPSLIITSDRSLKPEYSSETVSQYAATLKIGA